MQELKVLAEENVWAVAAGTAVVVLGTTLYWLTRGPRSRIMAKHDYNKQSVLLPVSLILYSETIGQRDKKSNWIVTIKLIKTVHKFYAMVLTMLTGAIKMMNLFIAWQLV